MAKKATKQTSDRVSRIAARVLTVLRGVLSSDVHRGDIWRRGVFVRSYELRVGDVKALAASALSQDETKGPRKPKKRAKAKRGARGR